MGNLSLIEDLQNQIKKLQAFKDYVHDRLDLAGVEKEPDGEHSKAGCRIGDRLDLALDHINMSGSKIEYISDKCNYGLFIAINEHKNLDESVKEYLGPDICDLIDKDLLQKMIEKDTVIKVDFYPLRNDSSNLIYHYDLDSAMIDAMNTLNNVKSTVFLGSTKGDC